MVEEALTKKDLEWLAEHFSEELCKQKNAEEPKKEKEDEKKSGYYSRPVRAGVIRHTSCPYRPLAYYYQK